MLSETYIAPSHASSRSRALSSLALAPVCRSLPRSITNHITHWRALNHSVRIIGMPAAVGAGEKGLFGVGADEEEDAPASERVWLGSLSSYMGTFACIPFARLPMRVFSSSSVFASSKARW